jgi:peptidoglycan/LPS O-acetylase OafA/YrhL
MHVSLFSQLLYFCQKQVEPEKIRQVNAFLPNRQVMKKTLSLTASRKERNSNLELLRLVCMLYIVLHHFVAYGLKIAGYRHGDIIDNATPAGLICNGFFVIGVNCFVLISGYFKIKASWKGFFHLFIVCVFYLLAFFLIFSIETNCFSPKSFAYSFLPFSHARGLWFIEVYVSLYLLSPMLNKAIDNLNRKAYIVMLLLWCILTFYFGYLWKGAINASGYNIIHFMLLYFIGNFIAKYISNVQTLKRKAAYLGIYLSLSGIIACGSLYILNSGVDKKWIDSLCFPYNSPLVVSSSIAFFLFFNSLNIQHKIINRMASSALAIYLIHENIFCKELFQQYVERLGQTTSNDALLAAELFLLAVGIMIGCILIDKVRMLFTNPVERLFNRFDWDGYASRLVNKIDKVVK